MNRKWAEVTFSKACINTSFPGRGVKLVLKDKHKEKVVSFYFM